MLEQLTGWLVPVPATTVATVLTTLVAAAAGLLVPAGIAKLRTPAVARTALGWSLSVGDRAVRLLGAGEVVLAVAVLVVGGPILTGLLALAYAGFAVVASRQRARGAGCGCFGATATPTGWTHVALDVTAAVVAVAAVIVVTPAPLALLAASGPLLGVAYGIGLVAAVATAQQLLTALPDLAAARAEGGLA